MLKTFRKYYLPGIISLVAVLFLLFYFLNVIQKSKEYVLEITMPGESNESNYNDLKPDIENRKRHDLNFQTRLADKEYIDSAFEEIKYIQKNKDSLNCYVFNNLDKKPYGTVVEILNQIRIHRLRYYALINSSFYILFIPEKVNLPASDEISYKTQKLLICGTGAIKSEEMRLAKVDNTWFTPIQDFLAFYNIPYWLFIALFFGIIFFYYILPFIQSKISSRQSATLL